MNESRTTNQIILNVANAFRNALLGTADSTELKSDSDSTPSAKIRPDLTMDFGSLFPVHKLTNVALGKSPLAVEHPTDRCVTHKHDVSCQARKPSHENH